MEVAQGEIWWADLPEPAGSAPGYRRPVLVVQNDQLNRSRFGTILCAPLTSNLRNAQLPGNVLLSSSATGLSKDSVAIASRILPVDRSLLVKRTGSLTRGELERVFQAIDFVLGR